MNTELPDPTKETAASAPDSATEAPPPAAPKKARESVWEIFRSLVIVLVLVAVFRTFIAEATVIPTPSMERTILIGDHVFLNKLLYGPTLPFTSLRLPPIRTVRRQEIVAFRNPRNPSLMFVKRVIGVGGDLVKIENRKVFVNGAALEEPYAQYQFGGFLPLRDTFPPSVEEISTFTAALGLHPDWANEMPRFIRRDGLRVPEGFLFVMGDNRDNSSDSRFWGFVPVENIVGEPLFVYWSYDAPSKDWTNEDLMARMKFNLSILWNIIHKTRWSRTGTTF